MWKIACILQKDKEMCQGQRIYLHDWQMGRVSKIFRK